MDPLVPPTSPLHRAASEPNLAALPDGYPLNEACAGDLRGFEFTEDSVGPASPPVSTRPADGTAIGMDYVPPLSVAYNSSPGTSLHVPTLPIPTPASVLRSLPSEPTGVVGNPQRSVLGGPPSDELTTAVSFSEYMLVEASRMTVPIPSHDEDFVQTSAPLRLHVPSTPEFSRTPAGAAERPVAASLSFPALDAHFDEASASLPASPASRRREITLDSVRRMVPVTPAATDGSAPVGCALPEASPPVSYFAGGMDSAAVVGGDSGIAQPHLHLPGVAGTGSMDGTAATGYAARRYKLRCFEISADGGVNERKLSRAEIMQAARETLPKNAPSPKAVARWLGRPEEDSEELLEFSARYGSGKETSRKAMQKALRNYLRNSLQPRDIRQVDPAFSAKPALWVRHSALVVSLEGVRAIVLHDKVFVFDPDHSVARSVVNVIRQSVTTSPDMLDDPDMPFEFKALEGMFIVGIMGLEREFNQLNPEVERHLHELPTQLTSKMLEELRINKQRLNHFLSRAHNVRDILEKLLDEDEDMANMYLTEKHRSPNVSRDVGEHDQVEMLLEAYMQVIDELVNRADLLNDAIDDTEDLVMIHLDTLRNKLLSVELGLSVVSMTFGFGGVLAGVFGMNLTIPLFVAPASKFWFLGVVCVIVTFILVVSWLLLLHLRRRGLYNFR
jgi:magnesium transporter